MVRRKKSNILAQVSERNITTTIFRKSPAALSKGSSVPGGLGRVKREITLPLTRQELAFLRKKQRR